MELAVYGINWKGSEMALGTSNEGKSGEMKTVRLLVVAGNLIRIKLNNTVNAIK